MIVYAIIYNSKAEADSLQDSLHAALVGKPKYNAANTSYCKVIAHLSDGRHATPIYLGDVPEWDEYILAVTEGLTVELLPSDWFPDPPE